MARLGYWRLAWMARTIGPDGPPDRAPGLGFEDLDVEAAEEWAALLPGAVPEVFRKRVREGQRCFAVRLDGRLASVSWAAVSEAQVRVLGETRTLRLEEEEVYVHGSWTRPDLRGRHLQHALMSRMLECFGREGYRRIVSLMVPENLANVRSRNRSGFRRTGTLHFLKLGPWRWEVLRGSRGPRQQKP